MIDPEPNVLTLYLSMEGGEQLCWMRKCATCVACFDAGRKPALCATAMEGT